MFDVLPSLVKPLLVILLYAAVITRTVAPPYGYDGSNILLNSTVEPVIIHTDSKYDVWPVITARVSVTYIETDGLQSTLPTQEIGRFGTGHVGSFQGWLHRGVPNDGCTQLQNTIKDYPWIAFVKRGGCTFSNKARCSIDAGANGMIVYSYNDRPLVTMDIEEPSFPTAMLPFDYALPMNLALDDDINIWINVSIGRNLTNNNAANMALNLTPCMTVMLVCVFSSLVE